MKGPPAYDERQALALTPLLEAIGREILERQDAVRDLVQRSTWVLADVDAVADELALHRAELERAHLELARLGCTLVGRRPMTFRIRRGGGYAGVFTYGKVVVPPWGVFHWVVKPIVG